MIEMSDDSLTPLYKVWVDHEPHSHNQFIVKINDEDYYSLLKEEIDLTRL